MSEVAFANRYIKLVDQAWPQPTTADEGLGQLAKIPKFGFPALKHPSVFTRNAQDGPKTITTMFRSFRTPRFTKKIDISSDSLIHKAKRLLQEALKKDGITVDIEQIVLMLKTRTVHDGTRISSLLKNAGDTSVTLNVFISKLSEKQESADEAINEDMPEIKPVVKKEKAEVSEEGWRKIYKVLKDEISDEKVRDGYYGRLRGVE